MSTSLVRYKELSTQDRLLIDSAYESLNKAHCPYSNFPVGAAVCGTDGTMVTGVNVENAAFEVVHAEAHALSQAQLRGIRPIDRIAVVTSSTAENTHDVYGPCGSCRQRILEFAQRDGHDILVLSTTADRTWVLRAPISTLLPFSFGPAALHSISSSRVIGE